MESLPRRARAFRQPIQADVSIAAYAKDEFTATDEQRIPKSHLRGYEEWNQDLAARSSQPPPPPPPHPDTRQQAWSSQHTRQPKLAIQDAPPPEQAAATQWNTWRSSWWADDMGQGSWWSTPWSSQPHKRSTTHGTQRGGAKQNGGRIPGVQSASSSQP